MLLALDPGLNRCGVALFNVDLLRAADTTTTPAVGEVCVRARAQANEVVRWIEKHTFVSGIDTLVVEWPQVYDARNPHKSKPGSGNSVLPLAAVIGGVAVLFPTAEVRSVLPREWKGQMPKRGSAGQVLAKERALKRLTDGEKACIPKRLAHDGWDAIGIGLWALGRWERQRVFPGAFVG